MRSGVNCNKFGAGFSDPFLAGANTEKSTVAGLLGKFGIGIEVDGLKGSVTGMGANGLGDWLGGGMEKLILEN